MHRVVYYGFFVFGKALCGGIILLLIEVVRIFQKFLSVNDRNCLAVLNSLSELFGQLKLLRA